MTSLQAEMAGAQAVHGRHGFRQKWLSASKVDQAGLRGWTPIIRRGQLVTVGTLFLAEMPEKDADLRETFFRQLDAEQQRLMQQFLVCRCWWCRLKRYVEVQLQRRGKR